MSEYDTYAVHHYTMINNVFGRFVSGLAHYLRTELIPRTQDTIISTYEKAIEHTRQRKKLAGENWSPKYPFLIIDPQIDLEPDPQAGRFLHGYPSFYQKFAAKLYKPNIYEDDNITISPILNRYRGTIECILYNSSIYEMIDNRVWIQQFFGGIGRPIYPKSFQTFIVIPDEYRTFTYKNRYTNEEYLMDWDSSNNSSQILLIKNINQDKLVFPFYITPFITLTGISDGADRYGGGSGDMIGDHRLNISLEWECSLPTHMLFSARYVPIPSIPMEFTFATKFKYIKNPITNDLLQIADELQSISDFGDESVLQSHPEKFNDTSTYERYTDRASKLDLVYDRSFNYILTASDISGLTIPDDSTSIGNNVIINLNERILDERYIRVRAKTGELDRDLQWKLADDEESIELLWNGVKNLFDEDDIIFILIYKQDSLQ